MKITKILNTNVVLSSNENNENIIVMGCGVAFNKKRGDIIDESKIERIFTQDVPRMTEKFKKLIQDIPLEYMEIAEQIINEASLQLGKNFNDNIYILLTDHIYFSVQRFREGMTITNRLLMETRQLYHEEFQVAENALRKINEKFNVNLPEDEVAFITLHFVNAELNGDMDDTLKMTKIVEDILTIMQNFLHIQYDVESFTYYRLVTHLKFLAQRILKKQKANHYEDQLLGIVKEKYRKSYQCVEQVSEYIKVTYDYRISKEDTLYLSIHIESLLLSYGKE